MDEERAPCTTYHATQEIEKVNAEESNRDRDVDTSLEHVREVPEGDAFARHPVRVLQGRPSQSQAKAQGGQEGSG